MKELDKRGQRRGGDFFGDVARGMVGSVPFVGSGMGSLTKFVRFEIGIGSDFVKFDFIFN